MMILGLGALASAYQELYLSDKAVSIGRKSLANKAGLYKI